MGRPELPPAMPMPARRGAEPEPVPDDLPDAEMLAELIRALGRQREIPPMPPTLTGIENEPRTEIPNVGADYERPMSGPNRPLDVLSAMPPDQLRALGTPESQAAADDFMERTRHPQGGR